MLSERNPIFYIPVFHTFRLMLVTWCYFFSNKRVGLHKESQRHIPANFKSLLQSTTLSSFLLVRSGLDELFHWRESRTKLQIHISIAFYKCNWLHKVRVSKKSGLKCFLNKKISLFNLISSLILPLHNKYMTCTVPLTPLHSHTWSKEGWMYQLLQLSSGHIFIFQT